MEHYMIIIDGSGLPEHIKTMLRKKLPVTLEELDEAYHELVYFLERKEYYNTLDRIEKGIAFLALQTDTGMIAKANARIKQLEQRLEELA